MSVIAIVNPKGGSGKSTLATHLAAYAAQQGLKVKLGDLDRQKSSQLWLRLRGEQAGVAPITQWASDIAGISRQASGLTVIDTPGGLRDCELARVVMAADWLLMPVGDSLFDRDAAEHCWAILRAHPRVQNGRLKVAAVGMRVDGRTHAESKLSTWAAELGLPFLGALRQTQTYTQCSEQGLTVFDLPEARTHVDRAQWQPVLDWLAPALTPMAADPTAEQAPTQAPTVVSVVPTAAIKPPAAVWQELAAALQAEPSAKPSRPGWMRRLAQMLSGTGPRAYPTVFQPSHMAAG
jgi:chromosome partitioning protein